MEANSFTSRGKNSFDREKWISGKFRWVIGLMALLFLGAGNVYGQVDWTGDISLTVAGTHIVTENTTINSLTIAGNGVIDVRIDAGVTLTVLQNCSIASGQTRRIIMDDGAELIVNGDLTVLSGNSHGIYGYGDCLVDVGRDLIMGIAAVNFLYLPDGTVKIGRNFTVTTSTQNATVLTVNGSSTTYPGMPAVQSGINIGILDMSEGYLGTCSRSFSLNAGANTRTVKKFIQSADCSTAYTISAGTNRITVSDYYLLNCNPNSNPSIGLNANTVFTVTTYKPGTLLTPDVCGPTLDPISCPTLQTYAGISSSASAVYIKGADFEPDYSVRFSLSGSDADKFEFCDDISGTNPANPKTIAVTSGNAATMNGTTGYPVYVRLKSSAAASASPYVATITAEVLDGDGVPMTGDKKSQTCTTLSGTVLSAPVFTLTCPAPFDTDVNELQSQLFKIKGSNIAGTLGTFTIALTGDDAADFQICTNPGDPCTSASLTFTEAQIDNKEISFYVHLLSGTVGTKSATITVSTANATGFAPVNATKQCNLSGEVYALVPRVAFGNKTESYEYCPGDGSTIQSSEVTIDTDPELRNSVASLSEVTFTWSRTRDSWTATGSTLVLDNLTFDDADEEYTVTATLNATTLGTQSYILTPRIAAFPQAGDTPSLSVAGGVTQGCPGDVVTINATSPFNTYQWRNSTTVLSGESGAQLKIKLEQDETYSITAKAFDVCGNSTTFSSPNAIISPKDEEECICKEDDDNPEFLINFENVTLGTNPANGTAVGVYPQLNPICSYVMYPGNDVRGHAITTNSHAMAHNVSTTNNGKYFLYHVANHNNAATPPHDFFTIKTNVDPGAYRLTMDVANLYNASQTTTLEVAGTQSQNLVATNSNTTIWNNVERIVTDEQLAQGVLVRFYVGNATKIALRIGIDNIKLVKLCPPTFKFTPNKGGCSTATLKLEATGTFDFASTGVTVSCNKINLATGSSTSVTATISGSVVNITNANMGAAGNFVYEATVTDAYNQSTILKSGIFTCQTASIAEDDVSLCQAGGTATLTANLSPAAGSYGITSYIWERRSDSGADWLPVVGETGSTLTRALDAGQYRVIIKTTYAEGTVISESNPVTVAVVPGTDLKWVGANSNWNDKNNWYDEGDAPAGFAPRACDNVTITLEGLTLPTIGDAAAYVQNITFKSNAAVGKINRLEYGSAFVDMEIYTSVIMPAPYNRWYMLTPPLKGMNSGHYQVPGYISYMRHFYVDGTTAKWTESLPHTDIDFAPGQSFVYKIAKLVFTNETSKPYVFENNFRSNSGGSLMVDYKDFDGNDEYEFKVDLSSQLESWHEESEFNHENGYVIVGNPFMSQLDIEEFLERNGGSSVYVYEGGDELEPGFAVKSGVISPMQAFCINPGVTGVTIGSELALTITEDMLVASEFGAKLRSTSASEDILRIRAKQEGNIISRDAIVIAKDGASNAFDPREDATKLFTDEARLEVSTLADNIACEINKIDRNALDGLSVPINIKSTKAGAITLEIDGAIGFISADNIYLYDDLTKTTTSLLEQGALLIPKDDEGNIEGRFFLQFAQETIEISEPTTIIDDTNGKLYIGARQSNLIVETRNEQILSVTVYDVAGRTVLDATNINSTAYSHALPVGATYIVKVVTSEKVKTAKIIIR